MSRLFNQTKKAQDWALRGTVTDDPEVAQVISTIRETDRAADLSRARFEDCRKIKLTFKPGQPLVSDHRVSKTLAGEAYRALRTRLMRIQAKQGVKSVVVSSTLPGEGKTLTTMNLALSFASLHDVSVLTIDGDLRTSGLTELMGDPSGPGLAEVLSGSAKFAEAVVATNLPNLYAVPSGVLKGSAPELFATPYWKEFVAWASEAFKIILIDAPSVLPLADFDLIAGACDGVLMVVRAQQTRRESLRKVAAQIDANKLLGVVYNGVEGMNHRGHERYFQEDPRKK